MYHRTSSSVAARARRLDGIRICRLPFRFAVRAGPTISSGDHRYVHNRARPAAAGLSRGAYSIGVPIGVPLARPLCRAHAGCGIATQAQRRLSPWSVHALLPSTREHACMHAHTCMHTRAWPHMHGHTCMATHAWPHMHAHPPGSQHPPLGR